MIRPGLEAEIQKNRVRQAEKDRSVAIYKRADIVEGLLKTYKQSFLPTVWREMPLHTDVCMFPVFKAILNRRTGDNVTEDSFADAMNELPGLIAGWQQRREANLRVAVRPLLVDGVDALKLATAVFSCKGLKNHCPGHITNTGIWQHRCPKSRRSSKVDRSIEIRNAKDLYEVQGYHCELSFDTERSTRVASVVRFVSRDPATTTAEEMDALGLEFISLNSSVSKYKSVGPGNDVLYGRHVFSWREGVSIYAISGSVQGANLSRSSMSRVVACSLRRTKPRSGRSSENHRGGKRKCSTASIVQAISTIQSRTRRLPDTLKTCVYIFTTDIFCSTPYETC